MFRSKPRTPTPFASTLRAELPSGWFAKESMTLLAPDGQANVIFSSEPLDPSIGSDEYASIQGDLLRDEFPAFHEQGFGPAPVFGADDGWMRVFSWTPPDGVAVTQIQLYLASSGRGYTATATTPSSNFPALNAVLRELLGSLRAG